MFLHNQQPQLQYAHYAEYNMFQHGAPSGSTFGLQHSAGMARKRTIHEACDEDLDLSSCSGPGFGHIASIKKRSEKPTETHIHASTLRRLFLAAQTQQQGFVGSRGRVSPASDLACEDCDNMIMLDEYMSDPDSYSCFSCSRTVCWRCSLRSQETNHALECLQCANSRSARR
ncbi:hypothetical protein POJ06DRAFT_247845 [Lipomyces tetrasporus]|uniref:Uncharacterized protein n=1 Tax=Lipomyces tetrasporus TaxID=54092 RepID=A0AAD7VU88_9ASCO|nr:uncharacterized protein POJ06DRAFT_247845 [Lipomyces tetrasporus]KAJ8101771.1 hypothetical protein POJ06DRAFT_247845 [Lipomyces tetrasporus]